MRWWERLGKFLGGKWPYLIVLIFGLMATVGIWGVPAQYLVADDYAFHVARMQSATAAWANGQILPQVDPAALGGFGYAYNLFYGPLLTYLASGIQFVINWWPVAVNFALVLCIVISGWTMCYAMTKTSRNKVLGALTAIIYMVAPYHLTDLYARMALGEVAALAVAPILLLGLYELGTQNKRAVRKIALAAALLILTHSLSAAIFAGMALVYVILNVRKTLNWEGIWRMILAVVTGLGLSAFFWLPLMEARMVGIYGVFNENYLATFFGANGGSVNDHRLYPPELVLTSDYNASYDLALGIVLWIGLIGFWFVRKKIADRDQRRFVTSLAVITLIALLLTLPILDWRILPTAVLQVQFPWRLLEIVTLAGSVVAAWTIYALIQDLAGWKQKILVVIVGMLALYSMASLVMPQPEKYLDEGGDEWKLTSSAVLGHQAEYAPTQLLCDPESAEDRAKGYACSLERIEEVLAERGDGLRVISGSAKINRAKKDGLKISFQVNEVAETTVVELPLIYYPGYQAKLGENKLEVSHSAEYGLVTVVLPRGAKGEVKVNYGLSQATQLGLLISVSFAVLGVIWLIITAILDKKARKKDAEMDRLMDSVREVIAEEAEAMPAEKPKKRGRSKKAQAEDILPPVMSESVDEAAVAEIAAKVQSAEKTETEVLPEVEVKPRRRGRPKKNVAKTNDGTSGTKTKVKTTKIKAHPGAKADNSDENETKAKVKTTRIKATSKKEEQK